MLQLQTSCSCQEPHLRRPEILLLVDNLLPATIHLRVLRPVSSPGTHTARMSNGSFHLIQGRARDDAGQPSSGSTKFISPSPAGPRGTHGRSVAQFKLRIADPAGLIILDER
ncbi:hypothetical protein C8Q80DRAFT_1162112, partial [Daedaleopsis nitida]